MLITCVQYVNGISAGEWKQSNSLAWVNGGVGYTASTAAGQSC